jgi:hypothetical protein
MIPQGLRDLASAYKKGFAVSEAITKELSNPEPIPGVPTKKEIYPTTLAPRFKKELKDAGISARETPAQFLGAFTARLITDVTNDGTRGVYWRYNHPLAIAEKAVEKAIGEKTYETLGPLKTGLIGAAVTVPAVAAAGAYDITNVAEQFRPKGFSQQYAEEGSEDRRQSADPTSELFERFFLGRTGRPLNYETAKKDIPDLTPERYSNYLSTYYQDRGLFGLVKATPENLQGVPEARVLGYPITIPMVAGLAGGATAVAATTRIAGQNKKLFKRAGIAGAVGSIGGIVAGNVINEAIAQGNRPKLPTVNEYQSMDTDRI